MSELTHPLVSVIMPSYNHEKYISEAIESVLSQTYHNFELIILDDGSTDETWNKISLYKDHERVKCYRSKNNGLIPTLKTLRSIAQGKYLTILASDDLFHRKKLEIMVEILETQPDAAMCIGKTAIIDQKGNFIKSMQNEYDGIGSLYTRLISGTTYVSSVSTMVRTDLYKTIDFINSYIEDLPAWLEIAKGRSVLYTPLIVASYRITSGSMSSNTLKMVRNEQEIIRKFMLRDNNTFNGYPKGWSARWFKALAALHKSEALSLLLSKECSTLIVIESDFYKGLIKLFFWWRR